MEKIAAMMFTGEDDPRRPLAAGNAGNDAFVSWFARLAQKLMYSTTWNCASHVSLLQR